MWELRRSAHPDIRAVWRAYVEEAADYTDDASEHWGLSFVRRADGSLTAEIAGPRVERRPIRSRTGETYWGVELAVHVLIPGVDKALLRGAIQTLDVEDDHVIIAGRRYRVPDWEQLEDFVSRLLADGALVADADIRRALAGDDDGLSRRSWQRRFRSVTGLRRKEIERLDRARHAYRLLCEGVRPARVAAAVGYADQAHLTRELRRIRGETPARILAATVRDG
ncbi:helix-turn-helix domain-containing protein [Myceligenerans pegani]|uniref:Helix-turn-helix domain-containing protein n=1 Tax=Myceligenerans pegani TaxID=2776917 RepID=A0ABR9N1S6_9MICO|nr:helix-turn-helix domain-containing protein [Myceligenerans sp. TRM 65318]MBE1877605.1 helix-turn-helix domain-containing protein [Myceligenerans sp. TRM 65318]MBE3019876.1 helix-turn-helix domain-containing protein [Myceligenerans sp. TRM 65318]